MNAYTLTPCRVIVGLLSDGSRMSFYQLKDATEWDIEKLKVTLAELCSDGLIKSIKRWVFEKVDA